MAINVVVCLLGSSVVYCVMVYIRRALRPGLRSVPGPFLARFSGLYRLYMSCSGVAPSIYRSLHEKHGKLVRVGWNHVSVSDPAMIPVIYGAGSKYLKTTFYSTMVPYYQDEELNSIFSTRDPEYHKNLKRPVAQLFSMSNMRNYEPYANECSAIFIQAMRELEGQKIDLSDWLQWYAFDVIACITFQRRFGFMEERRDINGMMGDIRAALSYFKVVTQYPALHSWGMGNRRVVNFIKKLTPDMPDALSRFLQITEEEIARYDRDEKKGDVERTDFLAQIRSKQQISNNINHKDLVNHLSNNILAGSDTTAVALRACFYYLIKTPSAYRKLQTEIDEADTRGELSPYISYEESLRLPYLQAVMKEALRIHSGICYPLERYVPEGGVTVCGIHLPAGVNISMSAPTVHFDKDIYGADVDQFRPERWIDSPAEQIREMDRCFLAFGQGARTCIGKNISILEMGKFLPQILRQFDVEWASDEAEWKTMAAWLWLQWGLIVRFKWRGKTPQEKIVGPEVVQSRKEETENTS